MRGNSLIFRLFDFSLSLILLFITLPLTIVIFIAIYLELGHPLFFQERLGLNAKPFILIKFRTMKINTPLSPTHLIDSSYVTRLGRFLRRSKLDELPQLWNVLKGEMSLVGPRPGLPSHKELFIERSNLKVFEVKPGITGLAQLSYIDMSDPKKLAETDAIMIRSLNLRLYIKYLFMTALGKGFGDNTA